MPSVHLLLGSNLGDRVALLDRARAEISARVGRIDRASGELSSEAWGYESENQYLNQVVVVETALAPLDLLDVTQSIERDMGRRPRSGTTYEDRPIDIDILYYDDLRFSSERLTIPHPEIENRPFVLALLGGGRSHDGGLGTCDLGLGVRARKPPRNAKHFAKSLARLFKGATRC